MNTNSSPKRKGSATAVEIYTSVGLALSWWEASEDILMGVFNLLCATREPTAFETYVASSRSVRGKMLLWAITRYEARFQPQEALAIRAAIKALDKLSPMRNQIAHGHVTNTNRTCDGVMMMEGHFLIPSLNEMGQHVTRDFRYAHTASEIDAWRDKVREERGCVMDIRLAVMSREQAVSMTPTPEGTESR